MRARPEHQALRCSVQRAGEGGRDFLQMVKGLVTDERYQRIE